MKIRYKFIGGLHDGEVHKVDVYLKEVEVDYIPPRFSFSFDGSESQPATYVERITSTYVKKTIQCEDETVVSLFVATKLAGLGTVDLIKYILSNYRKENGR
jgi:hypothetical protein